MTKKFWFVDREIFLSEKAERAHNGRCREKYMMPYYWCCEIRGEHGLVNKELPEEFRSNPIFKASRLVTVTREKFMEVRDMVLSHPSFSNLSPEKLKRGCSLPPFDFDPPSRKSDFAWCVGDAAWVVSDRVHAVMQTCAGKDFESMKLPQDYWLVVPKIKCLPPVERRGGPVCPLCGLHLNERNESKFLFEKDMMIDNGIFVLDTTLQVVISNELKEMIEALNPSNVLFKEVEYAV